MDEIAIAEQVFVQWAEAYADVVLGGRWSLQEWVKSDYLWMSLETYEALCGLRSMHTDPPTLFGFGVHLDIDGHIPDGRLEWIVKGAYPDTLDLGAAAE